MSAKKKLVFCADRPDMGPSGGAAGVMYLLRKYLIVDDRDMQIEYLYRNNGRTRFIFDLLRKRFKEHNNYYLCHEPDAAAILSLLGAHYSMIYHQQGPIVQEYINHTEKTSTFKIFKKKVIEKLAFRGADTVYFPSSGAADVYFRSKFAQVKREHVSIGKPLYNTINLDEEVIPLPDVKVDPECITFLSVGTMSKLKGQDLTFEFIKSYLTKTNMNIRWITVGSGLINSDINEKGVELQRSNSRFKYIHFDKIPHGSVLYLDSISDVYIMLHRSSIFDLATLEAMNSSCAVILSSIGGNLDFNANDNCILVDIENIQNGVDTFIKQDIKTLKHKNKQTFDNYFSPKSFSRRYTEILKDLK